ncbi:hypothetical protein OH146_12845 [Salinibacterium sp. SYSU T00001]|uniref:hypothetical protein n=1 Tax=Homoserinimonas sedimenticola TaxID=2986805 RepID=UPI0022366F95|nr:hypothetical protein [Salinibacterium sedimenticola]MCW4386661.1 hypothetical protein [Salinibacterium sedimenticola]
MSAVPVLKRVLLFGSLLALVIAVVGSLVGFAIAGMSGVASALVGTGMAMVFLGVTSLSIIIASRFDLAAFFGIVMGAWLLKFIVFLVLVFVLRDQPWVHTQVLFFSLVAAVIGTLVVDVVVIAKARMPYVSDVTLPGESDEREGR